MMTVNRHLKHIPAISIVVSAMVGVAMLWILGTVFSGSTLSLKSQSASQETLAFLSLGQNELKQLKYVLNELADHDNAAEVKKAQEIYQSLLDSLVVAGADTPELITEIPSDLLHLVRNVSAELLELRQDFARLTLPQDSKHAAKLAAQIEWIENKFDAVDWRQIKTITAAAQIEIDNLARLQILFVAGIVILILLSCLVGLVLVRKLDMQRGALHRSAARIKRAQITDALTKLPNRDAFDVLVDDVFTDRAVTTGYGIIVLKVRGVKHVNAQSGYSYGDEVIAKLSQQLSDYIFSLNKNNKIARTGGVEFSFLVHDVEDDSELCMLAYMLLAIVNVPKKHTDFYAELKGYAGVATPGATAGSARDLVLCADLAMQEASRKSENGVTVYSHPLRVKRIRKRKIEDELNSAIESQQIYPVYQPQFDMQNGNMVGMEALARWNHPELGMIPPPEFIAAAESVGGIVQIGRHILKTACEDAISMRGASSVSVNLSVLQIVQDDVPEFTKKILDETGLPANRLKLEVTESIIIGDSKRVYDTLTRLKRLGVSISLDDFGTGYSALSYLTDFDWDELKVDRSFVAKALHNEKAQHVARTIGLLANKMEARLTVEGIETSHQRDLFTTIGYQVAQGFFYSKPVSFAELNCSPYVMTTSKSALQTFH